MYVSKIRSKLEQILKKHKLKKVKIFIVKSPHKFAKRELKDYDAEKPMGIAFEYRDPSTNQYVIVIRNKITQGDIKQFADVMFIATGIDVPNALKTALCVASHSFLHEVAHILQKQGRLELLTKGDTKYPEKFVLENRCNEWAYKELIKKLRQK